MRVYYDLKTTNSSFIRMYKYLKKKRIRNRKFMLTLFNKDLIGVDPYDPNLETWQKLAIIQECNDNIWYFLREVVRIPRPGGGTAQFELDKSNCAMIWLAIQGINTWVTKPRALYTTISALCVVNYSRIFPIFESKGIERIRLLDRVQAECKELKKKLESLTECLPDYIQYMDMNKYKNVIDNTAIGTATTKDKAQKLGRSFNDTLIYFQDAEFINNITEIFHAALPVFEAASMAVEKKENCISCMMFASTISDETDVDTTILDHCMKWNDTLYDVRECYLREAVRATGMPMIHIFNHYEDLGKGKDWFDEMSLLLGKDEDTIRREVLLERKKK